MTTDQTQPSRVVSGPPRGWIRWTAVVLALAGWWLSLDLVKLGFGRDASTPWLQAECGATSEAAETLDCQAVLNSKWASIALSRQPGSPRIPVAAFGMGYFAFVGLWYLFVGPPTRRRWGWHLLIVLVVGCGALYSGHLIQVMNLLHKWCHGCLAVHAINGGLTLLTLAAFPWPRDRTGVTPHPAGRLALATLSASAFLFLMHPAMMLVLLANNSARQIYQAHTRIVDDPEFIRWNYQRQPLQTLLGDEQPTHAGDPDAPNTVVIFIDYQCPACKSAYDVLNTVMEKHPNQLRITHRHFPLDRTCNDQAPRSAHPVACRASLAAEAARVVGGTTGFRQMRALLYDRLNQLETARYQEWARELGLDVAAFSDALDSQAVADCIQTDVELGRQLGVEAIPVFFLNGRRLDYWSKVETWETLLGVESPAPTSSPTTP